MPRFEWSSWLPQIRTSNSFAAWTYDTVQHDTVPGRCDISCDLENGFEAAWQGTSARRSIPQSTMNQSMLIYMIDLSLIFIYHLSLIYNMVSWCFIYHSINYVWGGNLALDRGWEKARPFFLACLIFFLCLLVWISVENQQKRFRYVQIIMICHDHPGVGWPCWEVG